MRRLLLLAFLSAGCASPLRPTGPTAPLWGVPGPERAWSLAEGEVNLEAALRRQADELGLELVLGDAAREALAATSLRLPASMIVPADEVLAFLEAGLAAAGLGCRVEAGEAGEATRLHVLPSAELRESDVPRVSTEELALYRAQPALWVSCTLPAEEGVLPQHTGELAPFAASAQVKIARGSDGSLTLVGPAGWVADVVAWLWARSGEGRAAPLRTARQAPRATAPLLLPETPGAWRLADLAAAWGAATGQAIVLERGLAERELDPGIALPDEIPAARVQAFFETLLVVHRLEVRVCKGGAAPVTWIQEARHPLPLAAAPPLAPSRGELTAVAELPSTRARTRVPLEHLDPRQTATQARAMFSGRGRVLQPWGQGGVLLHGSGRALVESAKLLRGVDTLEGGATAADSTNRPDPARGRPMYLPAGEHTLEALLRRYAERTGTGFLLHPTTRNGVEFQAIRLKEPTSIPADLVRTYLEGLLDGTHLGLATVGGEDSGLEIVLPRGGHSNELFEVDTARWMDLAAIEEVARRPATLVRTSVALDDVDPRVLQTQLRGLVRNTSSEGITALGARSLVLKGTGPVVAERVRLLRALSDLPVESAPTVFDRPARDGLSVGPTTDVGQLLDAYARSVGFTPVVSPLHGWLDQSTLGLFRDHEGPASGTHALAHALLDSVGLHLLVLAPGNGGLVQVRSSVRSGPTTEGAPFVPEAELDRWADLTAARLQTAVRVEQLDARRLQGDLRRLDSRGHGLVVAAGERHLVMFGRAPWAAWMARLMDELEGAEDVTGPVALPTGSGTQEKPGTVALLAALERLARSRGETLVFHEHALANLRGSTVELSAEDVSSAQATSHRLEAALVETGHGLAPMVDREGLRILGVYSDSELRARALPASVREEDLEAVAANRPALYVRTLLRFPEGGATKLAAALVREHGSRHARSILAFHDRALLLLGPSTWVYGAVRGLRSDLPR